MKLSVRNPFLYLCAECGSPWKDRATNCWNCGSADYRDNPEYQQPVQHRGTQIPSLQPARQIERSDISNVPYLIATGIIAALAFLSGYAAASLESGVYAALIAGAIAWTLCQITITRKRTEHLEQMLADIAQRLPQ